MQVGGILPVNAEFDGRIQRENAAFYGGIQSSAGT